MIDLTSQYQSPVNARIVEALRKEHEARRRKELLLGILLGVATVDLLVLAWVLTKIGGAL